MKDVKITTILGVAWGRQLQNVERSLLPFPLMNDQGGIEEQGAKEEQMQKIDAIVGDEVLGYEGSAHGEHSGQTSDDGEEQSGDGLGDRLANNRPEQVK